MARRTLRVRLSKPVGCVGVVTHPIACEEGSLLGYVIKTGAIKKRPCFFGTGVWFFFVAADFSRLAKRLGQQIPTRRMNCH